jgi:SAM-dependent methyltransferase
MKRKSGAEKMDAHTSLNIDYYNNLRTDFRPNTRNHKKKMDKIIELLKLKPGNSVLEVGVGTGVHAEDLLKRVSVQYTGIDISEKCIAISKKRLPKDVVLMVANAEKMKFKDNQFDAVFCSGTLHHFNNQEKGLSEMVRVLKPNGRIVVMEPNRYFPLNFIKGALLKHERHCLRMSLGNFRRWSHNLPLSKVKADHYIYTPPSPKAFNHFYDSVDSALLHIPLINIFSIMIWMAGTKVQKGGRE